MDETSREVLGWALLFSLPMGVGIPLAVMRMSGKPFWDPLVFLPGVAATVVVFGFVALVGRDGGTDDA